MLTYKRNFPMSHLTKRRILSKLFGFSYFCFSEYRRIVTMFILQKKLTLVFLVFLIITGLSFNASATIVTEHIKTDTIWNASGMQILSSVPMTNLNSSGWYIYNFTTSTGFIQGTSYVYTIIGFLFVYIDIGWNACNHILLICIYLYMYVCLYVCTCECIY